MSELLNRLRDVIDDLERAPSLKADAATRLAKYRQTLDRRQRERSRIETELQELNGPLDTDVATPTLPDEMLERARQEKNKAHKGWLRS